MKAMSMKFLRLLGTALSNLGENEGKAFGLFK